MDKYEYKLKTEQMLELMEDGAYNKAAEIADMIDWKRVRNATMLTNVSDIYEKNGDYQKAYEVLNIAYHRAEGSRKVIYRLCALALKTGNVDEAIDYYDDFLQVAPKDPNQYILKYKILRARRAPVEQQIEALEEFKKAEYIEEWAYELAKLYQEAGMTAECLEECDDLILWFSEGKYVYKAMDLKMQYKPLTPSQQEKYDHRFERIESETEEIPDLAAYQAKKEAETTAKDEENTSEETVLADEEVSLEDKVSEEEGAGDESADSIENDEIVRRLTQKGIASTMKLQDALASLLNPKTEKPVKASEPEEDAPDVQDGLESAIEEIESVVDLDLVNEIADKKAEQSSVDTDLEELKAEPLEEEKLESAETGKIDAESVLEAEQSEEAEEPVEENQIGENLKAEQEHVDTAETEEQIDDDQIEGQMSLSDILTGWDNVLAEEDGETLEEETLEVEAEEKEKPILSPEIQRMIDEIEGVVPVEEPKQVKEPAKKAEEPHENMGQVTEQLRIDDDDDFLSGDESELEEELLDSDEPEVDEDILESEDSEPVEETQFADSLTVEDIEEGLLEGTGEEIETTSPNEESDGLFDDLPEEIETEESDEFWDDFEVELDDADDFDEGEDADDLDDEEADEYADDSDDEDDEYADDLDDEDDEYADDYDDDEDDEYADDFDEDDEYTDDFDDEDDEYTDDFDDEDDAEYADDYEEIAAGLEKEFRPNPRHASEPDEREIPDDDDGIDIMTATTPLSRKETAKLIATGKTAPLPLDEISDALSMSDTGFIVHGRYDLAAQSGIGTRAGLTEEQKKLFSYFVPVRGMSEQLVDVLEQDRNCTNREGTSRTGNLLIIGNKGNGKTVLAVDVVKAIQKQRNIRQGKVAIVTGDSLNKKKISDIFEKLYGGALIIEKAGKLDEKTVARLNKAMERDTGELLVVLEEQRKPLDRLLTSNREFRRKFTCRLEVPVFINDELVTFGQTYAQENGYRIDEMGILALYSRIDALQREDHAVTVAEVKGVMDQAIEHSQKASAKKLVRRVFGRNTDEADRIILSEKDFN